LALAGLVIRIIFCR